MGLVARKSEGILRALANARRLHALACVREADDPIGVAELADLIAARERGDATDDRGPDARQVHLSLHHVHLPKLGEAGIVEYDRDRKTVGLRRDARLVETVLDDVFAK